MANFRYRVTYMSLCDGHDKNGRFMRRWRVSCVELFTTKKNALKGVAWWVSSKREKATLKKIR